MFEKKWKWSLVLLVLFASIFVTGSLVVNANTPTVSMGEVQVESYYDKLREAFYMGTYDEVGACNGWVERVINRSGLIGELKVDGTTVLELNDALKNSSQGNGQKHAEYYSGIPVDQVSLQKL